VQKASDGFADGGDFVGQSAWFGGEEGAGVVGRGVGFLVEAGFNEEAEQVAYLNHVFGTSFDNLAELEAFNLQLVSDVWNKNQNGFVCAYELRGTRAHFDDPFINLTFFGISDDRVGKN
jgi:hypothetical protein